MPYGHVKQYRDLVREAQKKRIRITKEQQKEIRRIYADLADDLSSRLSRHSDKTLTYRWIKDYAKELRRESRGVYRTIQGITEKNMLAVTSAVTGAESAFWGGIAPELSERFTDVFSRVPNSVVNELLSGGVYRDFTGLSERIWNYQGKFNRDIQYVINQGIIAKKPAYDLAKDLEIYLNPKAAKPFDWSRVYPGVHKTVDYNAQRLARTGVTHAYQMSFQRSTRDNPFVEKYKWLSSNSGRSCELCRQRNGRLFEKDALPLDHPNGMCTVVAVIPKSYEQIADELADWANGKDNPGIDRWLGSDENQIKSEKSIAKSENSDKMELREHTKKIKSVLSDKEYTEFIDTVAGNQYVSKLYSAYADKLDGIKRVRGGGVYKPSLGTLEFDLATNVEMAAGMNKFGVLAHEYGHFFDHKAKFKATWGEIDMLQERLDHIGKTMFKKTPSTSGEFLDAVRADKKHIQSLWSNEAARDLRDHDASAGVQDAIDGMFGKRIKWGHGDQYYNRKYNMLKSLKLQKDVQQVYKELGMDASNQAKVKQIVRDYETASEMWANISSAETCGGEELEYIKKYLPNSYNAFKELLKGVE